MRHTQDKVCINLLQALESLLENLLGDVKNIPDSDVATRTGVEEPKLAAGREIARPDRAWFLESAGNERSDGI